MSLARKAKIKTEHAGAKSGGGHWGTRPEAKKVSKRHRREKDKEEIRKEYDFKYSKKNLESFGEPSGILDEPGFC